MLEMKIDITDQVRSILTKPPLNEFSDGSVHCFTS